MKADKLRNACLALLPLALAACQGEKPDDKARAGGEILPGSASDAMLPLDTLRSQPPLAPRPEASGTKVDAAAGAVEADAAPSESAAPAETAAKPAPAASTPSGE